MKNAIYNGFCQLSEIGMVKSRTEKNVKNQGGAIKIKGFNLFGGG